jgi:RHS repeat-associated protein
MRHCEEIAFLSAANSFAENMTLPTRVATPALHQTQCGASVRKDGTLSYMLADHLDSTSVTTDSAGSKVSEMRYTPWGEVRFHWVDQNLSTTPAYTLPKFSFTGQRSFMDDPSTSGMEGFGLMDYNARMYDPQVGRFTSADSIVPGGVQGLDRYAYVNNSPVNYVDPSGHVCASRANYHGTRTLRDEECEETPPSDLVDSMSSDDFEAALKTAQPGDEILYQWQGENYRLKCVTVDENGVCNLFWDLRTRQSIEDPWSFASRAVGFYQLQSNGFYKVYKGVGQWRNLPEYLEPDNTEDYYGDKEMLVIQQFPVGTTCKAECLLGLATTVYFWDTPAGPIALGITAFFFDIETGSVLVIFASPQMPSLP